MFSPTRELCVHVEGMTSCIYDTKNLNLSHFLSVQGATYLYITEVGCPVLISLTCIKAQNQTLTSRGFINRGDIRTELQELFGYSKGSTS